MLKKIKDLFLEQPPERLERCLNCNKKLIGRQMKFCSNKCNYQYWNKIRYGRAEIIDFSKRYCKYCGKEIDIFERNKNKFCSNNCRQYQWNKDNPEKFKKTQRKWFKKDYKKNKIKYIKKNINFYDENKEYNINRAKKYQKKTNYKSEKTNKERESRYVKKRTRTLFPFEGHNCEFCGKKATEHHHNTNPIKIDKFNFVCHNCHIIHHRLERQKSVKGGNKINAKKI